MASCPFEHRFARPDHQPLGRTKPPLVVQALSLRTADEHPGRFRGLAEDDDESAVLDERLVDPGEMWTHAIGVRRMKPGGTEQSLHLGADGKRIRDPEI